jgi:mono/diheme cytochrome c family protein
MFQPSHSARRTIGPTLVVALGLAVQLTFPMPASARPQAARRDVAAGREIAMDVCSACHIVAEHQEFPPTLEQHLLSFQEIADKPASTPKTLRHFIMTTHWDEKTVPITMPRMSLTDEQADQVTSYIFSLRKAR